jgi:uncharacterized membrane protein HdeD (DUF308 family)
MTASREGPSGQPGAGQASPPAPEVPSQLGAAAASPQAPEVPGQHGAGTPGQPGAAASSQPRAGAEHAAPDGQAAGYGGLMMPGAHAWPVMLVAAGAFFVVGLILLVWPKATLTIVAVLIGIALVVTGLVRLFDGFTAREESGGRRIADVLIGVLAIIVGLYCLRHHDLSIALVAFVVGAFWLLHGIADLAVAATAHGMPGRGLLAIAGVFSVIAGLLVLFWPAITVVLLVMILGIWLIIYAAVLAVLAVRLRPGKHAAAHQVTA